MVQRTVLKVPLSCEKCKKKVLKLVSSVEGVDKIEIDATKDTLTITGDGDPYAIILQARKAVKCVEVISIGPPPDPPKKPDEKKPDEKKPDEKKPDEKKPDEKKPDEKVKVPFPPYIHIPHNCIGCQPVAVVHMNHDPCTTCSIM